MKKFIDKYNVRQYNTVIFMQKAGKLFPDEAARIKRKMMMKYTSKG